MHIPYKTSAFSGKYTQCQMCRRKFIPEVLLASCETPLDLPYALQPQAFDVHVIRKIRPALEGEQLALHLSQIITFMEYELHSLIVAKLRYTLPLTLKPHFPSLSPQIPRPQLRIRRQVRSPRPTVYLCNILQHLFHLHLHPLHGLRHVFLPPLPSPAPAPPPAIRRRVKGRRRREYASVRACC
jgi:hypothetical protein